MGVLIRREVATVDLLAEMAALIEANIAETGALPGDRFGFNAGDYIAAENAGMIRAFIARGDAMQIVGYASHLVRKHPHFNDSVVAFQDAVYVSPEFRGEVGKSILQYADRELFQEGVAAVFRQSSEKRDITPLLSRFGYEVVEHTLMRKNPWV
jgi:GNAT superfamily N-acetyltransferase